MSEALADEIVEHLSPMGFEPTVDRLASAIEAAGMIVFARFDHAANARAAGMSMPSATVLVYGHGKGGTPVMQAAPLTALDLPLRVLVYDRADGRTAVAFHPVAPMLRRAGAPDELAARLEPAQRLLIAALAR